MTRQTDQTTELQAALVRKLERDGVLRHPLVKRAFRRVPRHLFLPEVDAELVYRDVAIPTRLQGGEIVSSSSQPSIMAIMLEQLKLRHGDNVLEIGAGTGFNAALLAEIVGPNGHVTTIDLDEPTVGYARGALAAAGYSQVRVEQADGFNGYAGLGPYDRIIATVGLGDIPRAWRDQLKTGGHLVLPLAIRGVMKAAAFRRDARGGLSSTSLKPAGFMPFRGARPLSIQELRVGPALGLFVWFPPDRGAADTDDLYAALQRSYVDIPTGIRLGRAEFNNGLNLWIRAHEAAVCTLRAEGALVEPGVVPGFTQNRFASALRDNLTLGLCQGDELAVLAWARDSVENGSTTTPFAELVVRAFGESGVLAQRLLGCVQAWKDMGSPTDEKLQIRVPADERRVLSGPDVARVPLASGVLELTWL
jgi:protein-L-isoaspartate(D-aspartate) O-methyltransferase